MLCTRCGLVAHEQMPSDEELAAYYAGQYRQDYHGEYQPSPHRVLRAWEGARWLFNLLRPHVPPGGRVLEVGAGIGCTVKAFELAGFSACGIEPGVGFQQFARDSLRADVALGSLADLVATPQYDFILLVHVIEHFNSPRRALEHLRRLLRPGGRLYVECPNVGAPHAAPGNLFHFAHIHNFTPDTLEMLAESCGFAITARLAPDHSRELRYVLTRRDETSWRLRPESYGRTLRALARYSWWGYHLRSRYLLDRCQRDWRFMTHHVFPRTRLRALLRRCQADERMPADHPAVPRWRARIRAATATKWSAAAGS